MTQVLNKRGGPFTDEDEQRLKAFTAQVAIALENAKLFDDVQNMKNYNESMLESMRSIYVVAATTIIFGALPDCVNANGDFAAIVEFDDGETDVYLGIPV